MVDLVVLILLVVHKLLELLAEEMDLAEIKGAEISKEGLIDQVVVDAEIEGVLAGFWRVLITDPVEAARDDLNGLVRLVGSARCSIVLCLHFCWRISATKCVVVKAGFDSPTVRIII